MHDLLSLASLQVCHTQNILLCTMDIIAQCCVTNRRHLFPAEWSNFTFTDSSTVEKGRYKGMPFPLKNMLAVDGWKIYDKWSP